jgi:hypothetical protein
MSSRPRRTRKDLNHSKVVADARAKGVYVWDLADLGGLVLDTVMFWKGVCIPVEIKQPGHESDLTEDERLSIELLKQMGIPFIIATCVEDIVNGWTT